MLTTKILMLGLLLTLLGAATWQLYGRRLLSSSALERRRRGRSYRRLTNRRSGPAIRLSVRTARP